MKELSDLFVECLKRYNNYPQCDPNTCPLKSYCTAINCEHGNCISCINHIQRANNPQFHYACKKITYHYVLSFFNRFASEIAYIIEYLRPNYLQGKTKLNVLSLGCGPGSEVYGFIKGLRNKAPQIELDYKGYDLCDAWNEVQNISKECLAQTPHHVEFYNENMFGAFEGFDDGCVDMLALNYLLSDSQKYYNDSGKLKFISEIKDFVIDNNVKNILFNDNGYYGKGGLDSGVGMMLRLIKEMKKDSQLTVFMRCFPTDRYIPSTSWKIYKQGKLLFPPLLENTLDVNISCCRSKQILVHIN